MAPKNSRQSNQILLRVSLPIKTKEEPINFLESLIILVLHLMRMQIISRFTRALIHSNPEIIQVAVKKTVEDVVNSSKV